MTPDSLGDHPRRSGYAAGTPWARLSGFSRAARHVGDIDELLGLALAFCTDLFPGTRAAIVCDGGNGPFVRATRPWVSATGRQFDESLWLAMARKAHGIEGAVLMDGDDPPVAGGLAFPLWAGERHHGVLCIAASHSFVPDPESLAALELIADRVAFALRRDTMVEVEAKTRAQLAAIAVDRELGLKQTLEDLDALRQAHAQLKLQEAELRRSEELLRQVLEHLPVGVWIADADGRPVQANPACRRIWGGAQGPFESDHPLSTDDWAVSRALDEGESTLNEVVRVEGTDGRPRVVVKSAVPIRDADGTVRGAVVVKEDITERHRAEADLRFLLDAGIRLGGSLDFDETVQRVARAAVPHLGDVAIVDLQSPEGFRRVAVAHADPRRQAQADRLLGIPVGGAMRSPIARAMRTRTPAWGDLTGEESETFACTPEQTLVLRELGICGYIVVPLVVREQVLGALTLLSTAQDRRFEARDVFTALELGRRAGIAIENARLHAAAVKAVTLRDELINVASHDLKTPLSAIHLRALMLERRLAAVAPPDAIEGVRGIIRTTRQMEMLIMDVLESARIHSGQLELSLSDEDLVRLTAEAIDTVRPIATQAGLRLEMALPSAPLVVRCDRGRVLQVLSNLLGNALKFTSSGGRIRVALELNNGRAVYRISDTGRGIDASELPQIFDRYRRASNSSGAFGIGLGLSIVKGIVDAHKGTVNVESELGVGTTITFALPRAGPHLQLVEAKSA